VLQRVVHHTRLPNMHSLQARHNSRLQLRLLSPGVLLQHLHPAVQHHWSHARTHIPLPWLCRQRK
jgi:hypothetical protein